MAAKFQALIDNRDALRADLKLLDTQIYLVHRREEIDKEIPALEHQTEEIWKQVAKMKETVSEYRRMERELAELKESAINHARYIKMKKAAITQKEATLALIGERAEMEAVSTMQFLHKMKTIMRTLTAISKAYAEEDALRNDLHPQRILTHILLLDGVREGVLTDVVYDVSQTHFTLLRVADETEKATRQLVTEVHTEAMKAYQEVDSVEAEWQEQKRQMREQYQYLITRDMELRHHVKRQKVYTSNAPLQMKDSFVPKSKSTAPADIYLSPPRTKRRKASPEKYNRRDDELAKEIAKLKDDEAEAQATLVQTKNVHLARIASLESSREAFRKERSLKEKALRLTHQDKIASVKRRDDLRREIMALTQQLKFLEDGDFGGEGTGDGEESTPQRERSTGSPAPRSPRSPMRRGGSPQRANSMASFPDWSKRPKPKLSSVSQDRLLTPTRSASRRIEETREQSAERAEVQRRQSEKRPNSPDWKATSLNNRRSPIRH